MTIPASQLCVGDILVTPNGPGTADTHELIVNIIPGASSQSLYVYVSTVDNGRERRRIHLNKRFQAHVIKENES